MEGSAGYCWEEMRRGRKREVLQSQFKVKRCAAPRCHKRARATRWGRARRPPARPSGFVFAKGKLGPAVRGVAGHPRGRLLAGDPEGSPGRAPTPRVSGGSRCRPAKPRRAPASALTSCCPAPSFPDPAGSQTEGPRAARSLRTGVVRPEARHFESSCGSL